MLAKAATALLRISFGVGTSSVLLLVPLLSLLLPLDCRDPALEVLELPASGEDDHSSGGGCKLAVEGKSGVPLLLWTTCRATVAMLAMAAVAPSAGTSSTG